MHLSSQTPSDSDAAKHTQEEEEDDDDVSEGQGSSDLGVRVVRYNMNLKQYALAEATAKLEVLMQLKNNLQSAGQHDMNGDSLL